MTINYYAKDIIILIRFCEMNILSAQKTKKVTILKYFMQKTKYHY